MNPAECDVFPRRIALLISIKPRRTALSGRHWKSDFIARDHLAHNLLIDPAFEGNHIAETYTARIQVLLECVEKESNVTMCYYYPDDVHTFTYYYPARLVQRTIRCGRFVAYFPVGIRFT